MSLIADAANVLQPGSEFWSGAADGHVQRRATGSCVDSINLRAVCMHNSRCIELVERAGIAECGFAIGIAPVDIRITGQQPFQRFKFSEL